MTTEKFNTPQNSVRRLKTPPAAPGAAFLPREQLSAFLLLLLAAASYAQTVLTGDAQAYVTSPLSEKQSAMTQDDSIGPFHINVPDEQLVNLRQRLAATTLA